MRCAQCVAAAPRPWRGTVRQPDFRPRLLVETVFNPGPHGGLAGLNESCGATIHYPWRCLFVASAIGGAGEPADGPKVTPAADSGGTCRANYERDDAFQNPKKAPPTRGVADVPPQIPALLGGGSSLTYHHSATLCGDVFYTGATPTRSSWHRMKRLASRRNFRWRTDYLARIIFCRADRGLVGPTLGGGCGGWRQSTRLSGSALRAIRRVLRAAGSTICLHADHRVLSGLARRFFLAMVLV